MKRLILAAMTVAVMTVASKAEAALAFSLVLCQGNTCSTFAQNLPNGIGILATGVGDYTINAVIAGGTEGVPTSVSATDTFTVTRTGQTSANPLTVWLSVRNYTVPLGPAYNLDVTMGTTQSDFGAAPGRGLVTYQAWYSSTNATFTGAPPAPVLPAGVQASNLGTCTPATGGVDSCSSNPGAVIVAPGSPLFSILSRTVINIGLNDTSQYQTTASANLSAVPEPGSMVLLGSGLLGMAAMLRRRYARK